jgi:hypothetical protein
MTVNDDTLTLINELVQETLPHGNLVIKLLTSNVCKLRWAALKMHRKTFQN